jgi:hypothetical protein
MTIQSTAGKVIVGGNGVATSFSFSPLTIFEDTDLQVTLVDTNGAESLLTEGTGANNYAVVVASYPGSGSITYPASGSAFLLTGQQLVMKAVLPLTQETELDNQGGYFADVQETAFDRQTVIAQQQQETINRALQLPLAVTGVSTTLAAPVAATLLGWATDGLSLINYGFASVGQVVASVFSLTLLVLSTAAAWRTALGLGSAATLAATSAGTSLVTAASASAALAVVNGGNLFNTLSGMKLSNDGTTPNTKLDVAAGFCADDTNAFLIAGSAGVIDCATVGANGLDAGALANATWYHVYAISKAAGASPALLASTSASAPTLPDTYTLKRRLGSFKTDGSAHILAFTQNGDEFLWPVIVPELATTTAGTAATLLTLAGSPSGVKVSALLRAAGSNASSFAVILSSPDENSAAVGAVTGNYSLVAPSGSLVGAAGHFSLRTNTSGQIRYVASASSTTLQIVSYGWTDTRGRIS